VGLSVPSAARIRIGFLVAGALVPLVLVVALIGRTSPDEPPVSPVEIVTVFDNEAAVTDVETGWGLAVWIRAGEETVLFDTGSDAEVVLANLRRLGLDPAQIDHVVLSHGHCDHAGGLAGLAEAAPGARIHLPFEPGATLCGKPLPARERIEVIRPVTTIAPGVRTTGVLRDGTDELGVVVNTSAGLVLITGCAHPGIVRLVHRATTVFPVRPMELVMGGFHLESASGDKLSRIVAAFLRLGVRTVAPTHCTGARARARFRAAYADRFLGGGVGFRFTARADTRSEEPS
jgi:7,8-dihydropterin-6-yl-methyl-4-(beta-D-ribofuranosyl)aminobenzene 5'-phosphate synthase